MVHNEQAGIVEGHFETTMGKDEGGISWMENDDNGQV